MWPSTDVPFTDTIAWAALSWELNLERQTVLHQPPPSGPVTTTFYSNNVNIPHKRVAFVWKHSDFHDLTKWGKSLSHELFFREKRDALQKWLSIGITLNLKRLHIAQNRIFKRQPTLTCKAVSDSATIHSAVAGTGLVHHLIKRQVLGICCEI